MSLPPPSSGQPKKSELRGKKCVWHRGGQQLQLTQVVLHKLTLGLIRTPLKPSFSRILSSPIHTNNSFDTALSFPHCPMHCICAPQFSLAITTAYPGLPQHNIRFFPRSSIFLYYLEDGGNKITRNVGTYIPIYTASYTRRLEYL
jgi:hypothetical protein